MFSLLIFAAAAGVQPNPSAACQKGVETVTDPSRGRVRAQKLNELPNANHYQAVVRMDEHGCSKPSIVAYDIGGAPRKQR